jgi:membrane fusion protein, hemolysin D
VRLTAPAEAVVLKMTDLSIGSVLEEGDPLMTLALLRSPVEAEADISTRDVGFIRVGDRVTLKIDAFNYVEHGTAEGRVRWISDGTFSHDQNGNEIGSGQNGNEIESGQNGNEVTPFYKVRIALTKVALKDVPRDFRLMPGMTLSADIHVGKRSAFMYMFGSFAGIGEAMREP